MAANNTNFEIFQLGDWKLQNGGIIPDAFLAYKTFGDPKSPAIVYPTWFSGCEMQMTQSSLGIEVLTTASYLR